LTGNISGIMITGTGSGCGKTAVTCALLSALKLRGKNVTAFKCGPDYIDPMFHSNIIGTKSRNLDVFLCGENTVKYLYLKNSAGADLSVIEGVMGMYDGVGFNDDSCSANHISRITGTPEILVVNAKGKGISLAAEISGYLGFAENRIKGIILDGCSENMYSIYAGMLENRLHVKCLGFLPHMKDLEIASRHLGLVTAAEIDDLKNKMTKLGELADKCLDIEEIEKLAGCADKIECTEPPVIRRKQRGKPVRIGIAKDKAFCFYYEDSLDLLRSFGAELIEFSPIADSKIPENIAGLIFGGGYPELYADKLSSNTGMLRSVLTASRGGMPVFAECGGFMYLGESITAGAKEYRMTGALPGHSFMTERLVRFGYKTLTAKRDNILCSAGESLHAHEFHYSDSDNCGDTFTAENGREEQWNEITADENIFAGYPHIHLWSAPSAAENFVQKCRIYSGTAK